MDVVKIAFELRDYQSNLVAKIRDSMYEGNRNILVVSAAGSGKSVVMADVAKMITDKGNRVLVAVHRIELVNQLKGSFDFHGVDTELSHIGMVQTITNRTEVIEEPDVIIFDEAHHTLAKTYVSIIDAFEDAHVFGFTATPVRTSGEGLGRVYDDLIVGKSVQWLIDNGNLAPFDYYSINMLDESKLGDTRMGDFTFAGIDEASKSVIYGDVIEHYKNLANNTKTLVYTHSVQSAKDVAQEFEDAGYHAQSVDGETPKAIREQVMEDFRNGEVTILVNSELFGEGLDIPDCETVILLRPTASLSLHVQQSMRPMRYQPNKRATIIDHVGNVHRHGLPTTEHEWTLEDRETNSVATPREDTLPIKECTNCFGVVESKETKCPLCGHEFEVEEHELEVVDAELEKINELSFTVNYEKMKWQRKKVSDLKTVEDYVRYADAMGYKKSWVKFQHPELKHMNWPQFYQKINTIKL